MTDLLMIGKERQIEKTKRKRHIEGQIDRESEVQSVKQTRKRCRLEKTKRKINRHKAL